MEQFVWIFWLVLGIALIIAETFTLGFILLWFGIGAIAAALGAWLGLGFGLQFLLFAGISIVLTAMSKTIFENYFSLGEGDMHRTGIDSLPGQIGTVTTASKGSLNKGEVHAYGTTWTAFPTEGSRLLTEGEKVVIDRVEGASVYVSPVSHEKKLPDWRSES